MSLEYDKYLEQHRANVLKGFNWFEKNLPDIFSPKIYKAVKKLITMTKQNKIFCN